MGKIIKGKYIEFDGRTSSSLNNVKIHFGIQQEGSGQPAVDNVRPLSGYGTIMLNISGKNLLNENLVVHNTWVRAGTDGSYGGRASDSYDAAFLDVASFQGKTLTISQGPEAGLDGSGLPYYGISFLDKTNTIQSYQRNTAGWGKPMTFVVPEGTARIGYTYPIQDRTTAQIELGDKVTNFDTRKAQRYPIIFKTNDTDLAHQNNCQILENIAVSDGGQLQASTRSLTMVLPCKPNTIYSIEHLVNNTKPGQERFAIGCNNTLQTAANTQINILSTLAQSCGYKYLTIKTLPDANYLYLRYRSGYTNETENTPEDCLAGLHVYECKELCNGIVDVNTGTVTVDWEYITFDGSSDEAWNVETGSAGINFYIQIPDAMIDNSYGDQVLCNIAKNRATGGWAQGCCFISSTKNLNLAIGDLIGVTSVANFKTWLASNNVQLVYKLATPKTYQIEPYTLELLSEKNILWTDSEVQVEAIIEDGSFTIRDSPEIMQKRRFFMANSPHLQQAESGNTGYCDSVAHFNTNLALPLKEATVTLFPTQGGSGDPSLTNVRSIGGLDGFTVTTAGVNLLECDTFSNGTQHNLTYTGTWNSDGQIESIKITGTTSQVNAFKNLNYTPNRIKVLPGTFSFHGYSSQVQILVGYVYADGTDGGIARDITTNENYWTGMQDASKWHKFNIPPNLQRSLARLQAAPYQSNLAINTTVYPMMCLPQDEGCDYEPFKGIKHEVLLPDYIYGGTVDLINGILTVTHKSFKPDGNTEVRGTNGNVIWITPPYELYHKSNMNATDGCYCNIIPTYSGTGDTNYSARFGYIEDKFYNLIYVYGLANKYSEVTDIASAKTFLINNNAEFVYKLQNPITYYIDPIVLRTFRGVNNIWSSLGTIDLKYWTNYKTASGNDIRGIKIYRDNATYIGSNGTVDNYFEDNRFFIAGPFDTGSEGSKTYTCSTWPMGSNDSSVSLRMYNDINSSSVDYWTVTRKVGITERTFTSVGRYVYYSVCKAYADTSYMYYTVDGVNHYLFKGADVP